MRELNMVESQNISGGLSHNDAIDFISILTGSQMFSAAARKALSNQAFLSKTNYYTHSLTSIIIDPVIKAIGGYAFYIAAQSYKTYFFDS